MPKLQRWRDHDERHRKHIKKRLAERFVTPASLKDHKDWANLRPEVPDDAWFNEYGDFAAVGDGDQQSSILAQDEPGRYGYDWKCWIKLWKKYGKDIHNHPDKLAVCWHKRKQAGYRKADV